MSSIFVDSGAHSLYTEYVIDKHHAEGYAFYESDGYWNYVDNYAKWIKERLHLIDVYVNVDVIFRPDLSWKTLKYLENTHKLNPMPVLHVNTPKKWIYKHLDNYEYLGVGATGQEGSVQGFIPWGDMFFDLISDKNGFPKYKIHGFAATSNLLLFRYPFFSADSTSWAHFGRFGAILIPKIKNGKYDYKTTPIILFISDRSTQKDNKGKHLDSFSKIEKNLIIKFIKDKGYKLGKSEYKKVPLGYKRKPGKEFLISKFKNHILIEDCIEEGVKNNNVMRDFFNAEYYKDLANSLPEWPWAFKHKERTLF